MSKLDTKLIARTQIDPELTERLFLLSEGQRFIEDELNTNFPESLRALAEYCIYLRDIRVASQ